MDCHPPPVFQTEERTQITNATQAQLDDVFREVFAQSGATLRKAETFFLHGATFAGLKLSPYFKAPRGVQGASAPRRTRKRTSGRTSSTPAAQAVVSDAAAGSTDAAPDDMRLRYFDVLLKKVDSTDATDADLLDRIERLIGIERPGPRSTPSRRTRVDAAASDGAATEPANAEPPTAELPKAESASEA